MIDRRSLYDLLLVSLIVVFPYGLFELLTIKINDYGLIKDFLRILIFSIYLFGIPPEKVRHRLWELGFKRLKVRDLLLVFVAFSPAMMAFHLTLLLSGNSLQAEGNFLLGVMALVIGQGILEESLFRGFLFRRLSEKMGLYQSAVITSLLFGLLHIIQLKKWGWAMTAYAINMAFLLSLLLCHIYHRLNNNLFAVILAHILYNYHLIFVKPSSGILEYLILAAGNFACLLLGLVLTFHWI